MAERKSYIVVADDDANTRRRVANNFKLAIPSGTIVEAGGALELFRLALNGDRGMQADLVSLDDNYGRDKFWRVESINKSYIDKIRAELRKRDLQDHEINTFLYPNALNYAVILRLLGYRQKIISISNAPPFEHDIHNWEKFTKISPLIDATTTKGNEDRNFMYWVGENIKWTRGRREGIEDGDLSDALRLIVPAVLGLD